MNTLARNIINLLEENGVPYRLLAHDEPVFTIETAARQRGVVKGTMVKSILLRESKKRDFRFVMACVPGVAPVFPQAVRAALPGEWKRLTFAARGEITAVTGYIMGAVAPLCLPDGVPVVFDETFVDFGAVSISSGDPELGVELDAADLIRLAAPILAPIQPPVDRPDA